MAADVPASCAKHLVHARAAIPPLALLEHGTNFDAEPSVVDVVRALVTSEPCIETAALDIEQAAQRGHWVVGLLRLDEGEPHLFRLAKKAVAFPRISTSISSRALSLRSCLSSSSSSGVSPVFSSASTIAFHADNTLVCTPSSRAIWDRFLPLSRMSLTASRLNSLLNRRRGRF